MGVEVDSEKITFTETSKLVDLVSTLYLNEEFSDIVLILDGEKLHAHKVILAARSQYFKARLQVDPSSVVSITINDVSSKAVHVLLKFIYTGSITIEPLNVDLTLEVLTLARKYSVKDLFSIIAQNLKTVMSLLNLNSICSLLNIANRLDSNELREICHNFLDNRPCEFLRNEIISQLSQESLVGLLKRDSFLAPEITIFKGICKWRESNKDVDNLALFCVRFSCLSVFEIMSEVLPSKMLDNEILLNAISEIVAVKPRRSNYRIQTIIVDENLATPDREAEVISGEGTEKLLTGELKDGGLCARSDSNDGFIIKLGAPALINYVHLKSNNTDFEYSYYIEISVDGKEWKKVIDYSHYKCRHDQYLYFEEEVAQFIRIDGRHKKESPWPNSLLLILFEVFYKSTIPRLLNGIICPTENVATCDKHAKASGGSVGIENLLNGDIENYDNQRGFATHLISSKKKISEKNCFLVELSQPFVISSMKLLLLDCDDRFYSYYIETSLNGNDWEMVVDKRNEECKSWQRLRFDERPVSQIKIVGTHNSANSNFHCVHFECPASD